MLAGSLWLEESGGSPLGWAARDGEQWRGPGPLGLCSVVSEGVSDSKVNCGALSLPSSSTQCLECLTFPFDRIR